jgi:hypothetical protein
MGTRGGKETAGRMGAYQVEDVTLHQQGEGHQQQHANHSAAALQDVQPASPSWLRHSAHERRGAVLVAATRRCQCLTCQRAPHDPPVPSHRSLVNDAQYRGERGLKMNMTTRCHMGDSLGVLGNGSGKFCMAAYKALNIPAECRGSSLVVGQKVFLFPF